jgi:hypothetical protein
MGSTERKEEARRKKQQLLTAICLLPTTKEGGLAQLARAPALQAGGHRFDSDILHQSEEGGSKEVTPTSRGSDILHQ